MYRRMATTILGEERRVALDSAMVRTAHGKLDLTLAPSGFSEGYTQLIADAEQRRVAATTITVAVASLADVEHSKRTADRAVLALEVLSGHAWSPSS
jgi:hypothetical protein